MTYWLEDKNGWVGDFASNGGIIDLLDKGPIPLRAFVANGGTDQASELKAVADACRVVPNVSYVADLLDKATIPVIITDGVGLVKDEKEDSRAIRFNPNHDDHTGEFSDGSDSVALDSSYVRPRVVHVATVDEAVAGVLRGEVVEMPDTASVHTLLSKLAVMAQEAKAAGQEAPKFNLCNVSVAGTNLFCTSKIVTPEFPNGIPRIQMPQLSGKPVAGTAADALPKKANGRVDGADHFVATLGEMGIGVSSESVPASWLRASQSELVGSEVAEMMASNSSLSRPIFVSRDNFVVDGHHRWAAIVGRDAADGHLGDLKMSVRRVDAPISEVLKIAETWSKQFGIAPNPNKALPRFNINHDPHTGQFASGSDSGAAVAVATGESSAAALAKFTSPLQQAKTFAAHGDILAASHVLGDEFKSKVASLVAAAPEATAYIHGKLASVMTTFGGEIHGEYTKLIGGDGVDAAVGAPKSADRIAQKAVLDYDGDVGRVADAARATVVVDKISDVNRIRESIHQNFDVVREKDRFSTPTGEGYRDLLFNVKTPGGLVGEIQVHARTMLHAKETLAHPIYEEFRTLAADAPERSGLVHAMTNIYEKAWHGTPRTASAVGENAMRYFEVEDRLYRSPDTLIGMEIRNEDGAWEPYLGDAAKVLLDGFQPGMPTTERRRVLLDAVLSVIGVRGNPNHAPSGESDGGQFSSGGGDGGGSAKGSGKAGGAKAGKDDKPGKATPPKTDTKTAGATDKTSDTTAATADTWIAANPKGNADVFNVAQGYMKSAGLQPLQVLSQQTLSPEEGRSIADSYDAAKDDPTNAKMKTAYEAFHSELAAQKVAIEAAGYTFEPWSKAGQPYANSAEMMKDVRDNKHEFFFKSEEGTAPNAVTTLAQNDVFRQVHDFFGHSMAGNQFGPKGETNAFLDHVQMFTPKARMALATETVAQNAWFNNSKENEGKPITERKFAVQKAFLLDPSLYSGLVKRAVVAVRAWLHQMFGHS